MALIVSDTYTDTNGASLATHTAETGGSPVLHTLSGTTMTIRTGGYAYGLSTSVYYYNVSPASADYSAKATLWINDNDAQYGGPGIRMDTSVLTGYFADYNTNGNKVELYKLVTGTRTVLGTPYNVTAVTGDTIEVIATGTALSVKYNDVEVVTATDSSVSSTGKPGIRVAGTGTSTAGVHMDTFVVNDSAGGGGGGSSAQTNRLLMGVG